MGCHILSPQAVRQGAKASYSSCNISQNGTGPHSPTGIPASNQQHGRVSLRLNGSLQLLSQGRGKKRKQRPYNQEDSKTSEDISACMYLHIDTCNCAYTESQEWLNKMGGGEIQSLKLKVC